MSRTLELTIPGEPVSKARARFTNYGSKVRTYTPEKTRTAEERVAWAYRARGGKPATDPEVTYSVEMHFYNGTRQRRDIDNMTKLVLDALNRIAWVDDNQVTEIRARKSYVPKDEARTTVRISETGRFERPTAPCLRCGTPFRTYESWQKSAGGRKYCSSDCAYKHRTDRRTRICKECGVSFMASGEASSARYCSQACVSAAKRATLDCDHCGTTFTKQRCHVKAKNYCSPECLGEAAKLRRSTRYPGTCITCGAGVTKKQYKRCVACVRAGSRTTAGKPQVTGPDMRAGEKRTTPAVHVLITEIQP